MIEHKTTAWLWGIVSLLFILSGLRDIFAPGFLSMNMNPHPKDTLSIAFCFAAGVIFLAIAAYHAVRARGERHISLT
jgi:hypothetical protein